MAITNPKIDTFWDTWYGTFEPSFVHYGGCRLYKLCDTEEYYDNMVETDEDIEVKDKEGNVKALRQITSISDGPRTCVAHTPINLWRVWDQPRLSGTYESLEAVKYAVDRHNNGLTIGCRGKL